MGQVNNLKNSLKLLACLPFGLMTTDIRENSFKFLRIARKAIEVASVIELSEASGRVAAGLFMTEG